MKLNTRFAALLGFLLAALVTSALILTKAQERQTQRSIALLQHEQAAQLDKILTLTTYPLQQFTRDYSLWDEMVQFVQKPTTDWSNINIEPSMEMFRLTGAWVLAADGREVYRATRPPLTDAAWPISRDQLLRRLKESPFLHFFVRSGTHLLEVQTSPIQPSDDITRTTPPIGWLLAIRHWNETELQNLAEITRSEVSIEDHDLEGSKRSSGTIEVIRPLPSLDGGAVAQLRLYFQPEQLVPLRRYGNEVLTILILQGTLAIFATVLGLHYWVVRPFQCISQSLATHDTSPVEKLARSRSELGNIARLTKEHFAAEEALRRSEHALSRSLEERVRVGRELHDGVIQSLYAAGMGLASIRDTLVSDPIGSGTKLDEVRSTLNETIREVRSYIVRLELNESQPREYMSCLQEVGRTLQLTSPEALRLEIDEAAVERMPINYRTDALQLVRDILQDAVKRREAKRCSVRINAVDQKTVFRVIDDGQPYASAKARPGDRLQMVERTTLPSGENQTTFTYSSF